MEDYQEIMAGITHRDLRRALISLLGAPLGGIWAERAVRHFCEGRFRIALGSPPNPYRGDIASVDQWGWLIVSKPQYAGAGRWLSASFGVGRRGRAVYDAQWNELVFTIHTAERKGLDNLFLPPTEQMMNSYVDWGEAWWEGEIWSSVSLLSACLEMVDGHKRRWIIIEFNPQTYRIDARLSHEPAEPGLVEICSARSVADLLGPNWDAVFSDRPMSKGDRADLLEAGAWWWVDTYGRGILQNVWGQERM